MSRSIPHSYQIITSLFSLHSHRGSDDHLLIQSPSLPRSLLWNMTDLFILNIHKLPFVTPSTSKPAPEKLFTKDQMVISSLENLRSVSLMLLSLPSMPSGSHLPLLIPLLKHLTLNLRPQSFIINPLHSNEHPTRPHPLRKQIQHPPWIIKVMKRHGYHNNIKPPLRSQLSIRS